METGSKTERVTAELAKAKERLAVRESDLAPKIRQERARIDSLKLAHDKASKAFDLLYNEKPKLRSLILQALGLADTTALSSQISAFLIEKNLPKADVKVLVRNHVERAMESDFRWQEHDQKMKAAGAVKEAAYRKYNTASWYGNPLNKMEWELQGLREQVEKLETELERIPQRNENARDKRRQEKEEAEMQRQTKEALTLLEARDALESFRLPAVESALQESK